MMKLNLNTWSTFGVALLLACSESKQDGSGNNNPSDAQGSATGSGTASTGSTGSSKASSGGAGSVIIITGISNQGGSAAAASSASGTGKSGSGSNGTGSTGSGTAESVGGSDVGSSVGGSGTEDPPADGGSGTQDPPAPVGDTSDPPVGDTGDPPVGDTGDPPVGDTGDPPVGDTGDPPVGDTGDPPVGDTPDPPEGCTMTEIDKVNVIVFKDATPTGADVEGKMWVGGNATFSGYSVGTTESAAAADCSYYSLVVGGSLSGQVNTNKGKVAVGSMGTGSVTATCGITRNQTVVDFPAIEKKLKGYSAAFRDYPPNGTVSVNSGITLTGTDKSLNVFNITAAQLTGTGTFKIVVPTTSSVIINVSGVGPINWSGVGFQLPDGASCRGGTSDWCHNILFNFYEATSIALSGIGVQGSVMAPYAKISGAGGNIDGQLVCDSLTGGIEYHPYFFTGCLLLNRK